LETQRRRFGRAIQILRVISEAQSADPRKFPNKYAICKISGPEYGTEPTILTAISQLEDTGHIKSAYIDQNARGGNPSKHYALTFQGLKMLIAGVREFDWDGAGFRKGTDFSTLARRHRDLFPELFTLWDRFERQEIAALLGDVVVSSADLGFPNEFDSSMEIAKGWKEDWLKEDGSRSPEEYPPTKLEEEWREHFLDSVILEIEAMGARNKFLNGVRNDPDVRKFYLDYLNRKRTEQVDYLNRIEAQIREVQ
jgi:hypothetical protein